MTIWKANLLFTFGRRTWCQVSQITTLHATVSDFLEPSVGLTSRPSFNQMIPYSMTATSHVALTLGTSLALFMSVTITGLIKHQERFFDMFLPPNLPLVLVPMMIALEVIGFFARAISLGVRLTANMLAGHTLLKLFGVLIWGLSLKGGVFILLDIMPSFVLCILVGLEFAVAFIQGEMADT